MQVSLNDVMEKMVQTQYSSKAPHFCIDAAMKAIFLPLVLPFLQLVASFSTMSGPVVALNAKFVLKPNRRAEFLDVIQKDATQTIKTEPGALQFTVGQDTEDSNVFHLHEQYMAEEDYDYHQSTMHFAEFKAFSESHPFAEDPVVNVYQCKHAPIKIAPRAAFCLNVESCIQPAFRSEFLTLMDSHQTQSRAEPLCLQFDYGEDVDNPNSFYIHEQYTGANGGNEGYDAHSMSLHFEKFMKFNAKNPYAKPQVASFFKSIV